MLSDITDHWKQCVDHLPVSTDFPSAMHSLCSHGMGGVVKRSRSRPCGGRRGRFQEYLQPRLKQPNL